MERLESIFDSIKERLTNPFVLSFIISWLAYNWQVTIALFWFNSSDLKAKGYTNLIDFITGTITSDDTWCWPVIFAFLYTFGMPVFRMLIEWFNAWIIKKSNKRLIKISEDTPVTYGKYFELKKAYKKLTDELASDIENATLNAQKYADIQSRLSETERTYSNTIDGLKRELDNSNINIREAELAKKEYERRISYSLEVIQQLNNKIDLIKELTKGLWHIEYENEESRYVWFITDKEEAPDERVLQIGSEKAELMIVTDTLRLDDAMMIAALFYSNNEDKRIYYNLEKESDKNEWSGYENDKKIRSMMVIAANKYRLS